MSQASSMARTTRQRTCRQRRRPPPTPTTDEATTCVVLTGAPISVAPSRTARRAGLARERVDRADQGDAADRASVTIGQPPIAVPSVSATPHASSTHVGDVRVLQLPAGDQQQRDHSHGLLRVVGAVD